MKLNKPKNITWLISLILGALGVVLQLGILSIPGLGMYSFWLVTAGLVLLLLGNSLKGL